jgi:hypothetical protein
MLTQDAAAAADPCTAAISTAVFEPTLVSSITEHMIFVFSIALLRLSNVSCRAAVHIFNWGENCSSVQGAFRAGMTASRCNLRYIRAQLIHQASMTSIRCNGHIKLAQAFQTQVFCSSIERTL